MLLEGSQSVEAKLQDQSLVVAFRRANPPLIWKFDLERNHSFTLALQGEEGDWELGVTSPKGEFYPVTHFLNREDAEEGFTAVQKIMTRQKRNWFSLVVKSICLMIGLIILGGIAYFAYSVMNLFPNSRELSALTSTQNLSGDTPIPADHLLQGPPPQNGTPVPADQLLDAPK